ncbi:MAG: FapA family protein [Ignavibacteriaceae bacterium]|nr:FapA family protein [Ignavibacteriaceae bacterium]
MPDNSNSRVGQLLQVNISEDKMKAFLSFVKTDDENPVPVSANDIYYELDKAGVKYGIFTDVVNDIAGGSKRGEKILIAAGHEPIDGEETRFEFFFPTEKSLKPQIQENGRIDYKEINLVSSVEKDMLLIRKIPATSGTNGVDVRGNAILAINGKDINVALGPGVFKDVETNLLVKAGVSGVVFYNPRNNYIEVQQLYVIPGSVNYSTGNVRVNCSVVVNGDVKPGFFITTKSNVDIKGVIEVASIKCEGTLNVKDGIIGDGNQVIAVGSDIHTGYLNKATIKCGGSVYVASEIRNSFIECNDELIIMKSFGVILGGKITAANKVIAPFIGNSYSIPTEIEVGIIPKYKEQYLAKVKERSAVKSQLEEYMQKVASLSKNSADGIIDSRLAAAVKQLNEYSVKLEKINEEIEEIEKAYLNVPDPGVYVARTIFPGVTIRIKHLELEVKEEHTHVMFKIVEDEIVCLPYR